MKDWELRFIRLDALWLLEQEGGNEMFIVFTNQNTYLKDFSRYNGKAIKAIDIYAPCTCRVIEWSRRYIIDFLWYEGLLETYTEHDVTWKTYQEVYMENNEKEETIANCLWDIFTIIYWDGKRTHEDIVLWEIKIGDLVYVLYTIIREKIGLDLIADNIGDEREKAQSLISKIEELINMYNKYGINNELTDLVDQLCEMMKNWFGDAMTHEFIMDQIYADNFSQKWLEQYIGNLGIPLSNTTHILNEIATLRRWLSESLIFEDIIRSKMKESSIETVGVMEEIEIIVDHLCTQIIGMINTSSDISIEKAQLVDYIIHGDYSSRWLLEKIDELCGQYLYDSSNAINIIIELMGLSDKYRLPEITLKKALDAAIHDEDYKKAAEIRDKLWIVPWE